MIVEPDSNEELEENLEEDTPTLPEKYQGKSMEEIIAMHENAEKEKSRLGNELGTLRKYTDKLLELDTRKVDSTPEPELDWDYDTKTAVETTVNSKVKSVDEKLSKLEEKLLLDDFKRRHPTFEDDSASPEFMDWVKASKYRTNLYNRNYQGIDIDAADELMNGWADYKETRKPDDTAQKRTKQLKDASLEKGSSGGSSKKRFNRTELINMKIYEPHKYEAMLPEIELAYKEGRVK